MLIVAAFAASVLLAQAVPAPPLGATRLFLDLDGSGRLDRIVLLQEKHSVTVVVHFPDPRRGPERFFFPADSGREDAICRVPARLRVESQDYDPSVALGEPLTGFIRSKTRKAFQLVDGVCDSIHFFWNYKTRRLDWWRL